MILVGCDLHTRKQQVALLNTDTGQMGQRAPLPIYSPFVWGPFRRPLDCGIVRPSVLAVLRLMSSIAGKSSLNELNPHP